MMKVERLFLYIILYMTVAGIFHGSAINAVYEACGGRVVISNAEKYSSLMWPMYIGVAFTTDAEKVSSVNYACKN